MEYISILNYSIGSIEIKTVSTANNIENYDDYLQGLGYNLSTISYMISEDLKIEFINN